MGGALRPFLQLTECWDRLDALTIRVSSSEDICRGSEEGIFDDGRGGLRLDADGSNATSDMVAEGQWRTVTCLILSQTLEDDWWLIMLNENSVI